jgi:hypothetical protein
MVGATSGKEGGQPLRVISTHVKSGGSAAREEQLRESSQAAPRRAKSSQVTEGDEDLLVLT